MHEQSETVERDGKFYNVYGRGTPKAGQDLPGEKPYDSLDAAVTAAKARSHSFDNPFGDIPAARGASPDPFADIPAVVVHLRNARVGAEDLERCRLVDRGGRHALR